MLDHLVAQSVDGVLAARCEKDSVAPPILRRTTPGEPLAPLQSVQQTHDGRLVEIQSMCELELRDTRIGLNEDQQTENRGSNLALADGAAEVAPQGDLRAAHIEADEVRQDADGNRL
jgi:hypothetical protein